MSQISAKGFESTLKSIYSLCCRPEERCINFIWKHDIITRGMKNVIVFGSVGNAWELLMPLALKVPQHKSVRLVVPHQRLLSKPRYYGIQGKTLSWINSRLTNRSQCVVVDGKASSFVKVTLGVPQGAFLGPLMFPLFINNIRENRQQSEIICRRCLALSNNWFNERLCYLTKWYREVNILGRDMANAV